MKFDCHTLKIRLDETPKTPEKIKIKNVTGNTAEELDRLSTKPIIATLATLRKQIFAKRQKVSIGVT